jgi:tRNA(Leu) C34 or U34 (ribose-2'-O)-methylase TrmL
VKGAETQHVGLAFGSETAGVTFLEDSCAGRSILQNSRFVYLPMHPSIRSQNLANTVAMALYEMSRQAGTLPRLDAATAKRSG